MEFSTLSSLPPDLIRLLGRDLIRLTGEDLVNLCLTNKYYNNLLCGSPEFWRFLYYRSLSDTPPPDRNFRKAFLEYYRLFKIGWIPILYLGAENGYEKLINRIVTEFRKGIDPDIFKYYLDESLEIAAETGHLKIVEILVGAGATSYNQAMGQAAQGGYLRIVNFFLDRGANYYNTAMAAAAREGHREIVILMIKRGAKNFNRALAEAAEGGYLGIIKLMIELGANDTNRAMKRAARGGHIEIVELMISLGANNFGEALNWAGSGGDLEIVKLLLEWGGAQITINDYNEGLISAAAAGYPEIIYLMIARGANALDRAMGMAAYNGRLEIVELLIRLGVRSYRQTMYQAARGGHPSIVNLMINLGGDQFTIGDYNNTLAQAAFAGNMEIIEKMIGFGARDYRTAMISAAEGKKTRTVEYFLKKDYPFTVDDYNEVLINEADNDNFPIIQLMLDKGANAYLEAIDDAEEAGSPEISNYIRRWMETHP